MIYLGLTKAAAIAVISAVIFTQVKNLKKILQQGKEVQQATAKDSEQIQRIISKKQNSNLHLLKLRPYYFQAKTKRVDVHTAQYYKYEPSNRKLAASVQNQLSTKIYFDNKQSAPTKWFAKVDHTEKYFAIQGFGKIRGDFLDIKSEYTPAKNLGYISRFRNWVIEFFYRDGYVVQQPKNVGFFLGPVVGFLKYEIDLMKDMKILAVCNIEDGKIIPQLTATSKSQLLNYYREKINEKYLIIGSLIVGAITIGRWLWSDIKAYLNALKVRNNQINNKYYKMNVPSQDKTCIICYNNSRNMIFFDCRHMIMCHECSERYESDVCPYCKMEIDDIKPVIGIN